MQTKKLLMISTDRMIFEEKSDVRIRQIEYAKNFDEVHIVILSKKNDLIALSQNCWAYPTNSKLKIFYPHDAIKIGRRIIEKNGITEITCQDPSLTAMVGYSLKKKYKLPLGLQIHGDISSPYFARSISNKIRLMMARRYLPRADKIRVVSERIKKYVELILGNSHSLIEVRPIAVNVDSIKSSPMTVDLHSKYKQFSKVALMASRLEKEKNIKLAIEVWSKVVEKIPDAGLVIVGRGSQKENLKTLIARLGLNKNIVLEDWADRSLLISYYKSADLFVNTSLYEGYGMTLLEAKAAGCPIISTDVGIAREVGAIIASFNSAGLADQITGLLQRNVKEQ